MQFLRFYQFKGSSYNLPAHGWCGARARKIETAAEKIGRPSEGAAEGVGEIPPRPSKK